ncbi:MAG: hypothetical protein Fur0037_00050 [Planctomycetota bacterium]
MLSIRSPLAVAVLALAPLSAQERVLPYLPRDTILAFSVPDLTASMERFASMPLAKIWREPDLQNFLADGMSMLREKIEEGLGRLEEMHAAGQLPVDPEVLKQLRVNGGTLAITTLAMEKGQMGPMPKVGILLHLDFGASAEQWGGLVQMGLGMMLQQAGDHVTREDGKVGECPVTTMIPNDAPPGFPMSLNVGFTKTGIVIGTLREDVHSVLENMQSGTEGLGATDRYLANLRHYDAGKSEAVMFLRFDSMLDFGLQALSVAAQEEPDLSGIDIDGIGRAIDALGLRGIESAGGSSAYVDGKCVTHSYIAAPAATRKGLLAGTNKTLDTSFLRWVPKDAVSFGGTTFEPMTLYDALVGALKAYDSQTADMVLTNLSQMEDQLGFKIREDLFGSIGDTFLTWSMPMGAMTAAPEASFLLKIKHEQSFVKVLENLAQLTGGTLELTQSEKRGVKAYSLRINADPGMGMNVFDMFTPTFAFKDGWMVGGFSASDIKRTFARMDREDDPKGDIRGNKEFAALAGAIPEGVQSLYFTDWKAQFEALYQMATGVLAFVPIPEEVPVDMSQLPEAETLTQHLFGAISYSKADGEGFLSTTVSPFGPEIVVCLGAVLGAGIAFAAASNF